MKARHSLKHGRLIQKGIYVVLLPALTITALLWLSPRSARPFLVESVWVDLAARVWLCGILTAQLVILSDRRWIRKWLLRVSDDKRVDESEGLAWSILVVGLFFALGSIVTLLAVGAFLPNLRPFAGAIAVAYGAAQAVPVGLSILRPVGASNG